ncbi:MAG: SDR family oxidoreductase [Kordiimonadaceae bacterium]|jgi:dTDP-4-dehydrorhamnose reductase|nr:SDR family oxidoreductase [Kordiimonadaceae bacterium]
MSLKTPRILLTGSTGLLAPYLGLEGEKHGAVLTSSRSGGDFVADLVNLSEVRTLIQWARPDWVVHAGAMTDVDKCERDPDRAFKNNTSAVSNLITALPRAAHLIYISTDQVYPAISGPHKEEATGPVNIYGMSKLRGEGEAKKHERTTILRTSFFGRSLTPGRVSLDDFMSNHFLKNEKFVLFSDVQFSPLHMTTLSNLIFLILRRGVTGSFNLGSLDGLSKADFGLALARRLGVTQGNVIIGESSEIPGRAPRPKDLRLNSDKIQQTLRIQLPKLTDEICRII